MRISALDRQAWACANQQSLTWIALGEDLLLESLTWIALGEDHLLELAVTLRDEGQQEGGSRN